MTKEELEALWTSSPNLRAFSMALRLGEGTTGPDGYRVMFGGARFCGPDGVLDTFDDFADHPRRAVTLRLRKGGVLTSTAAGAYQALERTWDETSRLYGLEDFSPHNQDLFCAARIVKRGAMADVLAGRVEDAVRKCNKEWASLPESPYGQPTVKMVDFVRFFNVALAQETVETAQVKAGIMPYGLKMESKVEPPAQPQPLIGGGEVLAEYGQQPAVEMVATEADRLQPKPEPLQKVGWIDALRVGQVVLDPARLKNAGTLAVLITTAFAAIAQFGGKYGLDLSWLDKDAATQLAGAIATVIVLYVNYASSSKVGILPRKGDDVRVRPDGGDDTGTKG